MGESFERLGESSQKLGISDNSEGHYNYPPSTMRERAAAGAVAEAGHEWEAGS